MKEADFARICTIACSVFTIRLPPLREREEDIAELAYCFLFRFNRELGTSVQSISESAWTCSHDTWPGNVRELQSVLKQAILQATGTVLLPEFLPPLPAGSVTEAPDRDAALAGLRRAIAWLWNNEKKDLWPTLEALTRQELLRYALTQPKESNVKLAERLGMARGTLIARLKELDGEPSEPDA